MVAREVSNAQKLQKLKEEQKAAGTGEAATATAGGAAGDAAKPAGGKCFVFIVVCGNNLCGSCNVCNVVLLSFNVKGQTHGMEGLKFLVYCVFIYFGALFCSELCARYCRSKHVCSYEDIFRDRNNTYVTFSSYFFSHSH